MWSRTVEIRGLNICFKKSRYWVPIHPVSMQTFLLYIRAYLQYSYLIRCLYMNALVSSEMANAIVLIRPTLWTAGHPTAALN
jgi:hypothetical protein